MAFLLGCTTCRPDAAKVHEVTFERGHSTLRRQSSTVVEAPSQRCKETPRYEAAPRCEPPTAQPTVVREVDGRSTPHEQYGIPAGDTMPMDLFPAFPPFRQSLGSPAPLSGRERHSLTMETGSLEESWGPEGSRKASLPARARHSLTMETGTLGESWDLTGSRSCSDDPAAVDAPPAVPSACDVGDSRTCTGGDTLPMLMSMPRRPQTQEEQELEALAKQLGCKQCPQCKNFCQKDESSGSNVRCVCGHEFCWRCLADTEKIRRHGNHFHEVRCRLYGKYWMPTNFEEKCPHCVKNGVACKPPKPPITQVRGTVLWEPGMPIERTTPTPQERWEAFAKGLMSKGPIERNITRFWTELTDR